MDKIENLTFTEACKLAHLGWSIVRESGDGIWIRYADVQGTDWVAIDEGHAVG